jgi:acetate kinase
MFCYRVAKYIGSYAVCLGKVDAIVFTAGIGENSASMRQEICSYLRIIGVKLDPIKNQNAMGKETDISAKGSKVRVLVIPTNEELMIAREAAEVIGKV